MRFTKMHGLGNDFVVVPADATVDEGRVRAWCDRRRGIGADGVLRVSASEGRVRMEYWNADGSPAEMCGNGLRCVARYALDRRLVDTSEFVIDTPVGPRSARVGETVEVELGPVRVTGEETLAGTPVVTVDAGNPHAVVTVPDPATAPVVEAGGRIEAAAGVNVEFMSVVGDDEIELRVWERGVGETLACGSGAGAAVMAARRAGRVGDDVVVRLPGGQLRVRVDGDTVWLEGPAETVFEGEWHG